jgi:hypothetical protein
MLVTVNVLPCDKSHHSGIHSSWDQTKVPKQIGSAILPFCTCLLHECLGE